MINEKITEKYQVWWEFMWFLETFREIRGIYTMLWKKVITWHLTCTSPEVIRTFGAKIILFTIKSAQTCPIQIVPQTAITSRILTPKQINMTRNFIWKRYSGWLTMGEGRVTEQASTLCQHLACRWGQYCLYLYIVQCCDFVLICIQIDLRMQVELDPETVIFATRTVIWDYCCICITKH